MIKASLEERVHFVMSVTGGMIGGYTILLRENFGSAQTANLIQLCISLKNGSIADVFLRGSAFVFYAGILAAVCAMMYLYSQNVKRICIIVEMIGVIIIGFFPEDMNSMVALLPVFMITALQWGCFNGTKEYNSPTLFSTGNIRNCVESWTKYRTTEESALKRKSIFYTRTLLSYYSGTVVEIYAVQRFHSKSIWLCLLPLSIVCAIIFCHEEK